MSLVCEPSAGGGGQVPPNAASVLDNESRIEFQWKVVQRFDQYIGSSNVKAGLLLTLNTFVAGAVLLKWHDTANLVGENKLLLAITATVLFVLAAAALASVWFCLRAIEPSLSSPKTPKRYHSLVFFGHVAEYESADQYLEQVREATPDVVADDLGKQAGALARIVSSKFWHIGWAAWIVAYVHVPAFAILLILLLGSAFVRHFGGGQ